MGYEDTITGAMAAANDHAATIRDRPPEPIPAGTDTAGMPEPTLEDIGRRMFEDRP